jgi:hypothetical protein
LALSIHANGVDADVEVVTLAGAASATWLGGLTEDDALPPLPFPPAFGLLPELPPLFAPGTFVAPPFPWSCPLLP